MEIPERMKRFPLWMGKYPIHYTVFVGKDGNPVFRDVARARQCEAARKNLCHLCGQRMTAPYYWIVGELNVRELETKDGPMHQECATYAIFSCPFLANPDYTGKRPTEEGVGPSVKQALVEMKATGPVERPNELALCTSETYTFDLRKQYPMFYVPTWASIDWDVIPKKTQ